MMKKKRAVKILVLYFIGYFDGFSVASSVSLRRDCLYVMDIH